MCCFSKLIKNNLIFCSSSISYVVYHCFKNNYSKKKPKLRLNKNNLKEYV